MEEGAESWGCRSCFTGAAGTGWLLLSWSAQQGSATSARRNELGFVAQEDLEPPASTRSRGLRVTKPQPELVESALGETRGAHGSLPFFWEPFPRGWQPGCVLSPHGRSQLLQGARARWRWHGWGLGVRGGAAWPQLSHLPSSQDARQAAGWRAGSHRIAVSLCFGKPRQEGSER